MVYFYSYIVLINLFGFVVMKIDKRRARKRKWRISEVQIWLISLIGGALGSTLGMFAFRHKTKHLKFRLGLPFLSFVQLIAFSML